MYLRLLFLVLLAGAVGIALTSCSQNTPDSWPVGHPPQKPDRVLPGRPNWWIPY